MPPRPRKFILAENLNKLARWLRLLGYDAVLYKSISFDNMIRIACKDRRILLTRSKKQSRSKKHFARHLIKEENHIEQLKEIKHLLVYDQERIFSRCMYCNKILYEIDKDKIRDKVPDYVWQNQDRFRVCRKCGRIYWLGTHTATIKKDLDKLFNQLTED